MSILKSQPIPVIDYPESDGQPMAETDKHRDLINQLISALEIFFAQVELYVSGNLMLYYVQGNPNKQVSPDVFVVRGIPNYKRRIYKVWEEGKVPDVVIELSSRKTWREDLHEKWRLYAELGVQEYFIFDPEYDYLVEPLLGWKLVDGQYLPVETKDDCLFSEMLGLDLVDTGETLRLRDPQTGQFLRTLAEAEAEIAALQEKLAAFQPK